MSEIFSFSSCSRADFFRADFLIPIKKTRSLDCGTPKSAACKTRGLKTKYPLSPAVEKSL
jgi:hypothetical protein